MPTLLPADDGESFIAKLEEAMEEGNADFIEGNLGRLEGLIFLYQERSHELAKLQSRAREIRDCHERPASSRGG